MEKLVRFLSKLPLFKAVYRQGGIDSFPLAHRDIMETMRDDLAAQADELAKSKLASLISLVDAARIVTFNDRTKQIYIGGNLADEATIANLQSEAKMVAETNLWKILTETPKELAHRAMFVADGDVETQLLKGRAMLYLIDTQERILNTFLT